MWDKVLKVGTGILTFIAIVFIVAFLWLNFASVKSPHITGAFIGNQVDPQTGEEKPLLEVNVYSNGNEKGKEVVEFRINGLSDVDGQTMYSIGAQLVDDKIYYYDTHNGVSWSSADPIITANAQNTASGWVAELTDNTTMIPVKLAGEDGGYAIAFSGLGSDTYRKNNGWKVFANVLFVGFPTIIWGQDGYSDVVTDYFVYSVEDFLVYCKSLATSISTGYGDTYIDAIDLAKYFGVYKLGSDNKYHDVEMYSSSGESKYYFSANVHYDYRGMQLASQSMFGAVANDSEYNTTGIESLEYWRTDINYLITKDDLLLTYDSTSSGYWLSLKDDVIRRLNNITASVVCDLIIDLDDFNGDKILGIDYYGFNGVKLKNLKITSLVNCNFEIRDYGLWNCSISNFEKSNTVTLKLSDNAYNGGDLA